MELTSPVTELSGVGPKVAKQLEKVHITSVLDMLLYVPRRYDDYSNVVPISTAKPGAITVKGRFEQVKARHGRRGLHITEAVIDDGTGKLKAIWFNQPYRSAGLPKGIDVYIAGNLERVGKGFALNNPSVERVSTFTKNTARIVPVYPETKDLNSGTVRRVMAPVIQSLQDDLEILPAEVVSKMELMPWGQALRTVHFPSSQTEAAAARERLAFDELFSLMLAHGLVREELSTHEAPAITFDEKLAKQFVAKLPFRLTNAQRRAAWEILQDIERKTPMNRLLEGDVGSGKTVVAAFAALMAARADAQVALMAPTEILARQHFETLSALLEPFKVAVALLVGGKKDEQTLTALKAGTLPLVIGTHALIQKHIDFHHLGLIIVDEQHRFGVRQRQALVGKGRSIPHVLSMTATPIPRSLTLTLYGELDVSVLDELPPGRKPVKTKVVSGRERPTLYKHIDDEIERGRQVYLICPLIEDSDTLGVKSVSTEYDRLQKTVFAHRRIGLLHGRLKSTDKQAVLQDFASGKLDILVATTVVEVGVDVPNASILLIEGAERFGLAQLHQLRGRVGRAEHQSYCYLLTSADHMARERLLYLERTASGFELAEADLQLRGPGEVYGTRQHGELDLRLARLTDTTLIARVQKAVRQVLDEGIDLNRYPQLKERVARQQVLAHLN